MWEHVCERGHVCGGVRSVWEAGVCERGEWEREHRRVCV